MSTSEDWIEACLGEVCSIEIGGTPSRGIPAYWDTERKTQNIWVSIKDMHQRTISDTAEQISDSGVKHSNAKLQPKGTVLLSFKLTIGRVAIAGVPLYTNEAIAGLKTTGNLTSEYLFHGLQYWDLRQDVDPAIKGATLNKEKLRRIKFVHPKFASEQAKIAKILSTVDRAIEQTEALIAKQQRIKTSLMQDLLTRGIDEHGNLRSEQTHQYKDSPIGRIPAEWTVYPCKEVTELITVGIVIRPAQYYVASGIPALRSANICEDGINTLDLVFVSSRSNDQLAKSQLRSGDVVTVRTGYPGTSAVVPPEFSGANCIDVLISRPSECLRSEFLATWINSPFGKNQVLRTQGGLAQQHFNVGELRNLIIPLPSLEEQDAIISVLSSSNASIAEERNFARKCHTIKQGLMHNLLTGKCRVTKI